jgi:hypothetical protein
MTPPKPENIPATNPTKTAPAPHGTQVLAVAPTAGADKSTEKLKPVSVLLSQDTHKKLRIVALSKGTTTSGLVESYVDSALRKDVPIALAKLSED